MARGSFAYRTAGGSSATPGEPGGGLPAGNEDGDTLIWNESLQIWQAVPPAAAFGTVDPDPDELLLRDGTGGGYVTALHTATVQALDSTGVEVQNENGDTLIHVGIGGSGSTTTDWATNLQAASDNTWNLGRNGAGARISRVNARQLVARGDSTDTLRNVVSSAGFSIENGVNPGAGSATYLTWQELGNWCLKPYVQDDSSGLPFDFDNGNIQTANLTGTRAITFLNLRAGGCYTIQLTQAAGGPYSVTWPAEAVFSGGFPPPLSRTEGAVDVFMGYSPDGTNLYISSFAIADGMVYQAVAEVTGSFGVSARACDYIPADATGGAGVINLPPAADVGRNQPITIIERGNSADGITINADGADTIGAAGATAVTLDTAGGAYTLISNEVDGWDCYPAPTAI